MAVFLSYAHEDADEAEALRVELEELAGPVWLDRGLTGGQVWWDEILAQLRECTLFVLALSDTSVRSEACLAEVSYVLALGRPFLAVRLAELDFEAAPEEIRRTQVIDFTIRSIESVRALAKAVLRINETDPLPDPLPDPPPVPQSYRERFSEVFAASLDLDRQLSIFARLRFDVENGNNAREATDLMRRLYDRADLSWKVRDEISAVLTPPVGDSPLASKHDPPAADPHAGGLEPDSVTPAKREEGAQPTVELIGRTWNRVDLDVSLHDCRFRLLHKMGLLNDTSSIAVETKTWSCTESLPLTQVGAPEYWLAQAWTLKSKARKARHEVIFASSGITSVSWILVVDGDEVHQGGKKPPETLRDDINVKLASKP